MLLKIRAYGDPTLRVRCKEVTEFDEELKTLVSDMIETMQEDFRGIGLAAPQIGREERLFITCICEYDENGKLHYERPWVYINPKILSYSAETDIRSEACLSLPGLQGDVQRPSRIVIEAQDENGSTFRRELEGFEARMVLHENDHINGVLFIDRMSKRSRKSLEKGLKRLKKKYPNGII